MKPFSAFIRTLLGPYAPAAADRTAEPVAIPPAATPEPESEPVLVGALIDLALVMRERWVPDASFAEPKGETEMLVEAALARVFPDHGATSDTCLRAADARLSAFLAPIRRPDWSFYLTPEGAARLSMTLAAAEAHIEKAEEEGYEVENFAIRIGR